MFFKKKSKNEMIQWFEKIYIYLINAKRYK
jgi:hypothetical protein